MTTTPVTFWKNDSFAKCTSKIQCNTCVDTKPTDNEITCIISGDIGGHRISSYCKQQKALQWPTNEAIIIFLVCTYL